VAILDRGGVIAVGSPEELLALDGGHGSRSIDLAGTYRRLTGREVADLLPRRRG